ncbi:hypothetical protein QFC20_004238 [Naganishia adeliensis]|uniref:Uncharacterized protein n=1 Tax=Naganishia adeliensis TaxID=92952 RepID=A0ACC2W3W6_9TREE|nr:hypothetical protein QFC20_004238 [Naganishia adeliensis]
MQLPPPHRRFHAKTILKTLIAIACLILVLARVQSISSIRQFLFDEEVQYGFPTLRDVTYQPKISLIGVWTGNEEPNYLTWFLESIARQPDEVELVVVQRGRNLGNFGGDVVARAKNIKVVKMSDDRWNISAADGDATSETDGGSTDISGTSGGTIRYGLSILRGEVFKAYIRPGVAWWGWCDFDTVMGRGHLTFFRNTPQAAERITAHPDFKTKEGWLGMRNFHHKLACRKLKTIGCSPKEASYSSYIVNNPDINFLTFDALPMKHYLAMTSDGVYSLQNGLEDPKRAALVAQRIADDKEGPQVISTPSTFSDQGRVRNITLVQGKYPAGALWFQPRHATHYEPIYGDGDPSFRNDDYLTYVYRLDGEVKERLEPVRRVEDRPDVMEEWLYLHWQEEKKKDWFLAIPAQAPGEDWILLTQGHERGGYWTFSEDGADRLSEQ